MPTSQRPTVPVALTIAGSDPSGGAGLQADLKTFHQHGLYGASVVTLVTAQNTRAVTRVELLPAELVRAQLLSVLEDLRPGAIKTGALGSSALIALVAETELPAPLVVDPVMVSKHGHALLDGASVSTLVSSLLPRTALLTPNLHEAAALLGAPISSLGQAAEAAAALARMGPRAVLVKAAALGGSSATDLLYVGGRLVTFEAPRIETRHTHGTGCSYSAAITAWLARGAPLEEAVRRAKAWLTRALQSPPAIGHGLGPVNHHAPVPELDH